jgi:hypothetical protein
MMEKVAATRIKSVTDYDSRLHSNEKLGINFSPEGGNHDFNRWNMHLPSRSDYINDNLIASPEIMAVLDPIFGESMSNFMIASDTPFPRSGFQSAHQDFPRFAVTVNIPLVDVTPDNGPLEVWPGSHEWSEVNASPGGGSGRLTETGLRQVLEKVQPIRPELKRGDVLIRDHRLVHRGTANVTDSPRPMLAIWYKSQRCWAPSDLCIPIPRRSVADKHADFARKARKTCLGQPHLKDVLNTANFYGRIVEELTGTDRDGHRGISAEVWNDLSPKAQHLLRFAVVDEPARQSSAQGSLLGSLILGAVGMGFSAALWYKMRRTKGPAQAAEGGRSPLSVESR